LTAYATGILNSLKHFTVPAFAPCLLNLSIIIFALVFGEGIKGLALGILVGGFLQLAIQVPVLYRLGFRFRRPRTFRHPELKTIGKLMLPRVLSTSIYQLNNFVDSIFGSLNFIVGEGGVAVLYFAYRLILFPLGIFSTSLSQAALPHFSTQALGDGRDELKKTLCWSLRVNFFVLLPSSVAFMVLAEPIISRLFGGGKFDAYSVRLTASALFFYSFGLFAYGGTKILQSCFFSLKDTVTPTKIAALALFMNIALNSILIFFLRIAGIALANSISGVVTFIILFGLLKKRIGDFETTRIIKSFFKILAASLFMGAICFLLSRQTFIHNKLLGLAVCIVAGFLSYAIFCFAFRVHEIKELSVWVFKRK
jgi:putative peptidoglycan lipid II flippase